MLNGTVGPFLPSVIKECELDPTLLCYTGPIATSLCEGIGFLRTPMQDPDSPNPAVQIYFFPVIRGPKLKQNCDISDEVRAIYYSP